MTRRRALSRQAQAVIAALLEAGSGWSYGYGLASLTGVKSGTLYPLLIRLEAQGYIEAEWQPAAAIGRPPRHAYRLTAAGRRFAQAQAAESGQAVSLRRWPAGEAAL